MLRIGRKIFLILPWVWLAWTLPRSTVLADHPGSWRILGPYGGHVSALASTNDGERLFAGTRGNGMFISDDSGGSWRSASTGLTYGFVSSVVADPSDAMMVFAATDGFQLGGVFKSTDGGVSWTLQATGLSDTQILTLHLDSTVPSILYAGSRGGRVFASYDGAKTWHELAAFGDAVKALATHPDNNQLLYAATFSSGIVRSLDGGKSWQASNGGLPHLFTCSLAIDPRQPDILYLGMIGGLQRSQDGGTTWQSLGENFDGLVVSAVIPDRDVPGRLLIGTRSMGAAKGEGVFESLDGGTTWRAIGPGDGEPGAADLEIVSLLVPPATDGAPSPSAVYAGTAAYGLLKQQAAALGTPGWMATHHGLGNLAISQIVVDASEPQRWFATVLPPSNTLPGTGIFRTDDGGGVWRRIHHGLITTDLRGLLQSSADPSTLFLATGGQDSSGLLRSHNGGQSWHELAFPGGALAALTEHPQNPDRLYVGVRGAGIKGLFGSVDRGESWSLLGLPNHWVRQLVFDPNTSDTLYAGTWEEPFDPPVAGGVYKSLDGGVTWELQTGGLGQQGLSVQALAIGTGSPGIDTGSSDEPAVIYAAISELWVGPRGIFRSLDGAVTWQPASDGLTDLQVYHLLTDPAMPGRVLAATETGIFESRNHGQTWDHISGGFPPGIGRTLYLTLGSTEASSLLVGTEGGVVVLDRGSPVFTDGFESGDTAAWSTAEPWTTVVGRHPHGRQLRTYPPQAPAANRALPPGSHPHL